MVVDCMVLDLDGFFVVKMMWVVVVCIFVLFLIVMSGVEECVEGFEVGGDDYFVKFFVFLEFVVRINVLVCCFFILVEKMILCVGDLEMDFVKCIVY